MLLNLRNRLRIEHVTPELAWMLVQKELRAFAGVGKGPRRVAAIFGCQRSGTSVLSRAFFRDMDCRVYRESSSLTGGQEGLRYPPVSELNSRLRRRKSPLVVFKMLVESQSAVQFLDGVEGARAIWLFRSYRDVVASNLNNFGADNGIRDIRLMLKRRSEDWRAENASPETLQTLEEHFHQKTTQADAAALFWWARNSLFFDQQLSADPRVYLLEYERLVSSPSHEMQLLYTFLDRKLPNDAIASEIADRSVGKGSAVTLSRAVETLCSDMHRRLCLLSRPESATASEAVSLRSPSAA